MSSIKKTVVWFRRDLRIEDNPALAAAAREGSVLPVYIWCPKEEGQFYPGRVSRWWLKQSLTHLGQSMRSLGAELILIKADDTLSALLDCINATGATKVVFNHLYDPVSLVRDHTIKEKMVEIGVSVQSFNGDLLHEPWEIYDEKGQAFTTFDAYWQKCQDMPSEPVLLPPPWRLVAATVGGKIEQCSIDELGLENDAEKASNALLGRAWSPGWSNGDRALTEFIENYLMDYSKNRQKVSGNSTSLLSPHLHFGELSIRKVFHSAHMKQILWAKEMNTAGQESVKFFMRAVGFREYSRYLLFNFPFTHERSLLRHLRFFPWNTDIDIFKAWRQGRTGYPLVDAGMREFWATGWIHNRIRVIVSSFAVKFLLIPWKWGMKYFWDTLLDADLECDILGWQYVSGSLPDGHELDRLDNPESDGVKFDPDGEYVRQWLPELARLSTEWIHHPWDAPASVLRASGVELGSNYPKPIVEFDSARDNLTQAIFMMREAENSYEAEEIVVDNYEALDTVKPSEPTVITISSNDQKVPSAHKNLCNSLKRQKLREDDDEEVREGRYGNKSRREYDETAGISRVDERVSSTAESCAGNEQTTGSNMFLVPHACSLLSDGKISEECENSGQSRAWQEHLDEGQSSTKDG